jgi:hypothetical protein
MSLFAPNPTKPNKMFPNSSAPAKIKCFHTSTFLYLHLPKVYSISPPLLQKSTISAKRETKAAGFNSSTISLKIT